MYQKFGECRYILLSKFHPKTCERLLKVFKRLFAV